MARELRERIKRIVPISPLTDLRPFLDISMNDTLRLDIEEAASESPVRHEVPEPPGAVWVGAEERPVFLDQAMALRDAWGCDLRVDPGRHHFDVIDGLMNADSPLVESILHGV